jgi:hypothetical protein
MVARKENPMTPRAAFLVSACVFMMSVGVGAGCVPEPPAWSDETGEAPSALSSTELLPAPSGCSAERSCGRSTIVCKRPDDARPCGAAGCVEMQFACSADADCLEGYACQACAAGDPWPCGFIDGRCRPRACTSDRACGSPNLVCSAGACAHKACRRSATCRGYCVSGACWDQPGWCHDTTLPPPP